MDFNIYQKKATKTSISLDRIKERYKDHLIPHEIWRTLGLAYVGLGLGEMGEVQDKIKKIIRDDAGELSKDKVDAIKKELGDCLWYIADACTRLQLNMNDVARENIQKLYSRRKKGTLHGSGDNR